MKELSHAKTTPNGASGQAWYSFCFDVFDSTVTDATVLRLFFAPVYLVYALKTPESEQLSKQEEWFEHYQETVRKAKLEDDPMLPSLLQLRSRVHMLEQHLSSSVREVTGQDIHAYFSRNDHVKDFPERFAAAFFPKGGGRLHTFLLDYYHVLMSKLFGGFPDLLDACISRLEAQNRDTVWYQIPTPDRPVASSQDYFSRVDTAANLLYSFALLSATHDISINPKKAARQRVIPDIFNAARRLLEIDDAEPDQEDSLSIRMTRSQFLTLCTAAADSRNRDQIRCLNEICRSCPSPGSAGAAHRQAIQHLLQKLRQYSNDCLQRISADYDKHRDDIYLLGAIADLETFWKQQLRSTVGDT